MNFLDYFFNLQKYDKNIKLKLYSIQDNHASMFLVKHLYHLELGIFLLFGAYALLF